MTLRLLLLLLLAAPAGLSAAGAPGAAHHFTVATVADIDRSLAEARGLPQGDTAYLHFTAPRYELQVPITLTPEDDRPLVFVGEGGEMPVISGGVRLTGWTMTPEGRWRLRIPEAARYGWRFSQLYVGGRRATRARTPNEGWYTFDHSIEYTKTIPTWAGNPVALIAMHTAPDNLQAVAGLSRGDLDRAVGVFYNKWNSARLPIIRVEQDSARFFTYHADSRMWQPRDRNVRYYIENVPAALDAPGEWFLDREGTLTYIPLPGETPEATEVVAPVLEQLLVIRGEEGRVVADKTFRRLCFAETDFRQPATGTRPAQGAADIDATVRADHALRIAFQDCEVRRTGNYGVWLADRCVDCRVERCYLYDIGAGGIRLGLNDKAVEGREVTRGTVVDNNILQHLGLVHPAGVGILLGHTAHNRVTHNDISDLRYTGISVGWTWGWGYSPSRDNEIGHNHIHHVGWGQLSDMGGIYTLAYSPGTRVHGNVLHDIYSFGYGGWGIYNDEGSRGIVVENNLVYRTKNGGYTQHYGDSNQIRNNIFAWGKLQQIYHTVTPRHSALSFTHNIIIQSEGLTLRGPWERDSLAADYNCYHNLAPRADGKFFRDYTFGQWQRRKEPHSIQADPLFRDPEHGDFRFRSLRTARRIGFRPFDYSQAGVYGPREWRDRARVPQEVTDAFARLFRQKAGEEEK